jgi:transposase-like protein
MRIREFFNSFSNVKSCREHFLQNRIKEGVICKKCGSGEHYWLRNKEQFECKKCKFRTTLRSGTIMQASKLPFSYWYIAMYLMSHSKKSLSALQMQRELSHKRYEPIWAMMHKIRTLMSKYQESIVMKGFVELDDAFIAVKTPGGKKNNKQGRGTITKSSVLVLAETSDINTKKTKYAKHSAFRKVRFIVSNDLKSNSIVKILKNKIESNTIVLTDGYKGYSNLNSGHISLTIEPIMADKLLPWVHTSISNVKRMLLGIFHSITPVHLQKYLDEFSFKTNNRNRIDQLFNILLTSSILCY